MFLDVQRSFPASLLYRDAALPGHEKATRRNAPECATFSVKQRKFREFCFLRI